MGSILEQYQTQAGEDTEVSKKVLSEDLEGEVVTAKKAMEGCCRHVP